MNQDMKNLNVPETNQAICWYRILTAPGPGAVAVIELFCSSIDIAQFVLRRLISASKSSIDGAVGRIRYGRWNDEDLVVVRTAQRIWEIHCHGGAIALARIRSDLSSDKVQEGCPIAETALEAGDVSWIQTAGLEDVQQLVQSAIHCRLPNARSRKSLGLILAQASNSLCDDLRQILDTGQKDTTDAMAIRRQLGGWKDIADHLTKPWRVVLAGAPNVGKSSLMNAIAGMQRSIVCDSPGTTRDAVEVDAMIDGWSFRFVDTAGIRKGNVDDIEERGMILSRREASHCDVLCLVFDGESGIPEWSDQLSIAALPKNTVLVRNKSDLETKQNSLQTPLPNASTLADLPMIKVSAVTGEGLSVLLDWIKKSVVPQEPTKDTALPLYCL